MNRRTDRPPGRTLGEMRRLRLLVLLAAALTLGTLGCAASDGEPLPTVPRLGLVSNTLDWGTQMAAMQRRSRDLGAGWLREEIRWNEVEPVRGTRRWARTDRLVASATRRGLRILPLLIGTPRWAAPDPTTIPTDPRRYAAFARDVVRRYGPDGAFWRANPDLDRRFAMAWFELWNEPFLPQFAADRQDAGTYARLVQAAGNAIHAAHPRARVLAAMEYEWKTPDGTFRRWVRDVHAAVPELAESYDGVAVHPYSPGAPIGTAAAGASKDLRRMELIREDLRAVGGPTDQVWITEIGWPTCPQRPACVSRAQQARYLEQAIRAAGGRYRGWVRALFAYALFDFRPASGEPLREGAFGLLELDGREKPAAAVLRRAGR